MQSKLLQTVIGTRPGLGPLALRIPAGIIFMAHGSQKLFGLFGGYGLEGTAHWMASIGLHPAYLLATLAGSAEFFGGLGLLVGLLVRPAAAALTFTMLVAIFSVHISNGLFLTNNGYEYALSLLAVSVSLVVTGAGSLSLDSTITRLRRPEAVDNNLEGLVIR